MHDQARALRDLVRAERQREATHPLVLLVAVDDVAARQSVRESLDTSAIHGWRMQDAGPGYHTAEAPLWQSAAAVVLSTSADDAGVCAAYRAVKLASADVRLPPVGVVFVGPSRDEAEQAFARLGATCLQFLPSASLQLIAIDAAGRFDNLQAFVKRTITLPALCSNGDVV